MIVGAGLVIEAMGEPHADDDLAKSVPDIADTAVAAISAHQGNKTTNSPGRRDESLGEHLRDTEALAEPTSG